MLKARTPGVATMEFHVARDARDRYRFDDSLYSITGNVILANFHAARVFAQRMNQKRDLVNYPEQSVKASQINAMGLIHELTHYMFRAYREQNNPQLLTQTLGLRRTASKSGSHQAFPLNFPFSPLLRTKTMKSCASCGRAS